SRPSGARGPGRRISPPCPAGLDREVGETWRSPPLCHRPGYGLDIDQERLVLRRLDIGVPDKGRQRVRPETLPGGAGKAPMQRDADDVHRLAIATDPEDALGDDGFRLHRAALRPDPDPASGFDAFLLGELFADLDEELRLQHRVDVHVRGPEVY